MLTPVEDICHRMASPEYAARFYIERVNSRAEYLWWLRHKRLGRIKMRIDDALEGLLERLH